jgi:hypothetical protein
LYGKDTIFEHINGEAEVYFPYGFKQAAVVTYRSEADTGLSVMADVYEMGSLLDAFGIYSNYRYKDAEFIEVGAEGFCNPYQLLFYQDRYFVRLAAVGDTAKTPEALRACAEAVAERLPKDDREPEELRLLASDCVFMGSTKYVAQSVLGYAFFRRGLVADTKLAGEQTSRAFAVLTETPTEAAAALDAYAAYLTEKSALFQRIDLGDSTHEERILAMDPLYRGVAVQRAGAHLIGVANLGEPHHGIPLLESLVAGPAVAHELTVRGW